MAHADRSLCVGGDLTTVRHSSPPCRNLKANTDWGPCRDHGDKLDRLPTLSAFLFLNSGSREWEQPLP
jgi:hypothetical protein